LDGGDPMALELNRIYNMDCLEGMKEIEDGSIDLVITDPPYLMNHTSGSQTNCSMKEKWQGHLKAADVTANMENTIRFSEWLPEVMRVLGNPGHTYIFTNDKNIQELLNESINVGFKLHNILVWKKNNSTPNRWYMKSCEFVIFLHKGTSFPIKNTGSNQFLEYDNILGNLKNHPTEKPLKLIKNFIANSCQKEHIVFDPFMGSGTTAEAAICTGRQFIGFEKEKTYFDVAETRIKKAQEQGKISEWF
jgi:site-specific DNA-methyltransferase (adenine-specific)